MDISLTSSLISSKVNISAASQEIYRLLWNPKFHYRVHKSPSLHHMLRHFNPIHILTPYSYMIHFNINFLFTQGYLK